MESYMLRVEQAKMELKKRKEQQKKTVKKETKEKDL
jgi:hypothetical protein